MNWMMLVVWIEGDCYFVFWLAIRAGCGLFGYCGILVCSSALSKNVADGDLDCTEGCAVCTLLGILPCPLGNYERFVNGRF